MIENIPFQNHRDCPEEDCPTCHDYTLLVYLNRDWSGDMHGETVFFDSNGELLAAVSPRYGRVALFRGKIWHSARPPISTFQGNLKWINQRKNIIVGFSCWSRKVKNMDLQSWMMLSIDNCPHSFQSHCVSAPECIFMSTEFKGILYSFKPPPPSSSSPNPVNVRFTS